MDQPPSRQREMARWLRELRAWGATPPEGLDALPVPPDVATALCRKVVRDQVATRIEADLRADFEDPLLCEAFEFCRLRFLEQNFREKQSSSTPKTPSELAAESEADAREIMSELDEALQKEEADHKALQEELRQLQRVREVTQRVALADRRAMQEAAELGTVDLGLVGALFAKSLSNGIAN
eukprot:TRINITY_DN5865_c0_g1_i1.p2 TRINITY_DN5865_c0_g1~~TRINITY_DN5865_c0_g1_i1.p2  ORF type:complete len:182 (-),score=26.67 TRINITY_DN5865_c0_g1_i1:200-745(-)